jgi:hypothetical protein
LTFAENFQTCRQWNELEALGSPAVPGQLWKLQYISGWFEGMRAMTFGFALSHIPDGKDDAFFREMTSIQEEFFPSKAAFVEIAKGIDQICSRPENAQIYMRFS